MACKQPASHGCSEPPVRQPGGDYLRSETRGERAAPRPDAAHSHESDDAVAPDKRVPAYERCWDGQLCSPGPGRCAPRRPQRVAAWGQSFPQLDQVHWDVQTHGYGRAEGQGKVASRSLWGLVSSARAGGDDVELGDGTQGVTTTSGDEGARGKEAIHAKSGEVRARFEASWPQDHCRAESWPGTSP